MTSAVLVVLIIAYTGTSHGKAFGYILSFTGSVAGGFLSFIFPAVLYLKLKEKDTNVEASKRLTARILAAFGVFVVIIVPVTIFL